MRCIRVLQFGVHHVQGPRGVVGQVNPGTPEFKLPAQNFAVGTVFIHHQ